MFFRPFRFCLNYLFFTIVVAIIGGLVGMFLAIDISTTATTVVPPLIAGMMEGQYFARTYQGRPAKSVIWIASLKMAILLTVVSSVLFVALVLAVPVIGDLFLGLPPVVLAIISLVSVALTWVLLRIGYGLGLRSGLQQVA